MLQRARGYRWLAAFLTLGYILAVGIVGLGHRAPIVAQASADTPAMLAVLDFLPDGDSPVLCNDEPAPDHAAHAYICDACRIVDAPGLSIATWTPSPAIRVEHKIAALVASNLFTVTSVGPPLGSRAPPLLTA